MTSIYMTGLLQILQGKINLATDTLKYALFTNNYVPNTDSDQYYGGGSGISATAGNEVSGTGYTAGGVAVASPALSQVAANSWGVTAAASTAYKVGQVVKPAAANGNVYRCIIAGTSGASAPSWGTVLGGTTTDGTVTWANIGSSAIKYSIADPQWTNATITAYYGVLYDTTANANGQLILLDDFGGAITGTNGPFNVNIDPSGLLVAARA